MIHSLPRVLTAGLLAGAALAPALTAPTQAQVTQKTLFAPVAFEIHDNRVVPSEHFAVLTRVLGSAIKDGTVDVPVTTRITVGGDAVTPWGGFASPDSGNVNISGLRQDYILPVEYEGGVDVTVAARSWKSDGSVHIFADSALPLDQIWVLRDGDTPPAVDGLGDQASLLEFVAGYVEDGKVKLHPNQIIYLFELGTLDLDSEAADFQDLVVLVTLGESIDELEKFLYDGPLAAFD